MSANQAEKSHLFTLRLWGKEAEDGRMQWRGKLHHINANEVRYFQEWPALIPLLLTMLRTSSVRPKGNQENTNQFTENELGD